MAGQNALEIKEKILWVLKKRGPSLPVHIATETGLSILFSSAFLSELLSEKKIKISIMRVGSSPIYFLEGQEYMLERFANSLKSKEKDAFVLLRKEKFLRDTEQTPAIRVALRAIGDFAVPFRKNNEIFWRYYLTPESEFPGFHGDSEIKKSSPVIIVEEEISETIIEPETKIIQEKFESPITPSSEIKKIEVQKELSSSEKEKPKKASIKKPIKKKLEKESDKFFNKVKEWMSHNSMEIVDIAGLTKSNIILRIKPSNTNEEQLLIAFNKKKLTDSDIVKAGKKASEIGLRYHLISLGEPSKKIIDLMNAGKNLVNLKKI